MVDLLIDSENKYRSLVESMEESVIVLDKDGNYLFHQSPSSFVQHLNNEGYIGKSVYDSIPKKSADRLMANVRNVFSTKRSHFDENHIDRGKGYERWITYRVTPQLNSAGEVDSVLVISTDTTNRKILENDLKDSVKTLKSQQKTLQQLSREAINTQEKERQRISHELHDDIGQSLTAISLNLESINLDKRHEAKLKDRIKDSQKLVQKTIDDVHRFSYALRPPIIDDLGLIPALQSQAENFQKRTGIIVKIKGSKEVENTTSEIKTILYRVFQEGLNNIAKHSKASTARIVLRIEDHSIILEISDNGKGFDTDKVPNMSEKGYLGLQGIEERVKLVGGSLQLQSNFKSGTTLIVKTPYAEA
jgi:PAS domain S-box-containing protein